MAPQPFARQFQALRPVVLGIIHPQADGASFHVLAAVRHQQKTQRIGGIARIYLTNSLSVTGELTGIKIPSTSQRSGHYADFNTYATLNFTHHVGVEGGYRSFDVQYTVNQDSGTMTLKGWYAALAIRF